jgi:hypothetical protein
MKNGEKGQALVIVLALVAFGALVITPFLSHADSGLIGSRLYGKAISQQYSADAGVEHAIWRLKYKGLAGNLTAPGNSITYPLGESINGIKPYITVVREETTPGYNWLFNITSVAGNNAIQAVVAENTTTGNVTVRKWQITHCLDPGL